MTYEELKKLKNGTTIVIKYQSGRCICCLLEKDCIVDGLKYWYMHKGERVSLSQIQLATKEDIELYIYSLQRKLFQLERELKAGL